MENKPNLYIFVIDVSSEMKYLVNEIDYSVKTKLIQIKENKPTDHILFLFFDGQVRTKKSSIITTIKSFTLKREISFFTNNERDFQKVIIEINSSIQKKSSCFNVQKPIIFTNQTSKKFIDIKELSSKYEFILLEKKQNNFQKIANNFYYIVLLPFLVFLTAFIVDKIYQNIKLQNIQNKINTEIAKLKIDTKKIEIEFKPTINNDYYKLVTEHIFEFSLQSKKISDIIPYYPDGAYDLENSKCDCPISIKFANFAVDKIQNDLNKAYINSTYPLYINITGETDSNPIQKPYKYKYENNTTDSIKFVLNGKDTIVKFTENSFITHNKKLACLRSYSIGKFLIHKLPIIKQNQKNIQYFATTNLKEAGGEYRKTKIELIYKDYSLFYWFIFISIFLLIVLFLFCFWLFVKYFKGKIIFFNFENNK